MRSRGGRRARRAAWCIRMQRRFQSPNMRGARLPCCERSACRLYLALICLVSLVLVRNFIEKRAQVWTGCSPDAASIDRLYEGGRVSVAALSYAKQRGIASRPSGKAIILSAAALLGKLHELEFCAQRRSRVQHAASDGRGNADCL